MKIRSNRGWWFVLPVVVIVAMTAVVPLMTVVNYSLQDIFDIQSRIYVGFDWYRETLRDPGLQAAFVRQLTFSAVVLAIELPLGVLVAKCMPRDGFGATLLLVVVALPLLIPWNVIGVIWQLFARADIGLLGTAVNALGVDYNYAANASDAWLTLVLLDVWHWTPLVVLLAYAGFRSVPPAFYQAAAIDGAGPWQVFRYVEVPRLRSVMLIAVLLRLMDSLMIYTEPFVLTGGGPGNATTFLSQYLTSLAVGQFDLGPAAAFSVLYFLLVLALSWLFYTALIGDDTE